MTDRNQTRLNVEKNKISSILLISQRLQWYGCESGIAIIEITLTFPLSYHTKFYFLCRKFDSIKTLLPPLV